MVELFSSSNLYFVVGVYDFGKLDIGIGEHS